MVHGKWAFGVKVGKMERLAYGNNELEIFQFLS